MIDTGHRYSWIKSAEDVPELQTEPEKWELLPDKTNGYFLILKRRETSTPEDDIMTWFGLIIPVI